MNWHIVVRLGDADLFTPSLPAGTPVLVVTLGGGDTSQRVRTNCMEAMEERFGRRPAGVSLELLLCAIGVYCADMCVSREQTSDRWTRNFTLHVPVADPERWRSSSASLVRMLRFLTGDEWEVLFRPREPLAAQVVPPSAVDDLEVSLFSGGLDSTIGAVNLLAAERRVLLIGHYGAGVTHSFQDRVLATLRDEYPDAVGAMLVHLQPPNLPAEIEHENTARSRSLLFIALGVAAANLTGEGKGVCISENGLISLNVPMTATRAGSLSTRTTHPHFIALFQSVLDAVGLKHLLRLPYRYQTKGEMIRDCADPALLRRLSPLTMSCAHPENARWEGGTPGTHCGHCLPCLVRRAAVAAASYPDAAYQLDVLTNPPDASNDRGRDFRALAMAVERFRGMGESRLLFEVLNGGPLPADTFRDSVTVYRRGMAELQNLLQQR